MNEANRIKQMMNINFSMSKNKNCIIYFKIVFDNDPII